MVGPRSTWRLAAVVLAAIWVVTPALAAVHGALESHSYCAEHGAFEHTVDDPSGPTALVADSGERPGVTAPPGPSDSHEACALGDTVLRDGVVVDAPGAVAIAPRSHPAPVAIATLTGAAPIDILALAPKNSPPA